MFRSKQSRLLCLLFALILCFQSFGLGVSAASDNLIDSNLSNWEDCSKYDETSFPITVTPSGNIYRLTLTEQDYPIYFGCILDETSLIAGHSYSLSFKLPSRSECNEAFGNSYSASVYENHFKNSEIFIGIGYISSAGEVSLPDSGLLYHITKDNYTSFFGKTLKASFIASNFTGTPAVLINIVSLDGSKHTFYFSDFRLVDNDDNSAELTGIKGFLHSIRWDLVGGTCEEEDCPHSSGDNPHLSLSERMSSGFASMFQNIGDKFEEGSTLNTWFTNLANKVGNVDSSISDLGDREEGFFSGLGDKIKGFFGDLGDDLDTWFDDLKKSWDQWIDDIQQTFDDVGASIENKFQEISDGFTEFFDKFKPRVHVNLKWVRGLVNWSTGELMLRDEAYPYVVVSDLFEIPHGTNYLIDFVCDDVTKGLAIHKYDLNGNFIRSDAYSKSFEGMALESGYQYRFRTQYTTGIEDLSIVNDYVVLYSDEGWVNALLYNMKMGIKGLFVPDEQAILDWKESLNTLLKNHLGIIYTCSDLLTNTLNMAFDIIFDAPDTYEIKIPEVSFEAAGTTVPVFSAQNIDFSFMEKPVFKGLYSMYTVALYIFFGALEVKYALRVYRKVMNN